MTALRDRLRQLALNLYWTWQPSLIALFRDLDRHAWDACGHNPIAMLDRISDDALQARVEETGLDAQIALAERQLQRYLVDERTWCSARGGVLHSVPIAYFSAEFGLHESLPLYSGGLGVLAGDYLKSASDLGLPVIGVGLFYANGYFHQKVDASGWQHEEYGRTNLAMLPLVRAGDANGRPLTIEVECGSDRVRVSVWLVHVGRVRLLLLDTDDPANPPAVRELTARLYGGDELVRIRQEIVLGIGGVRALRAIGVRPIVMHLNEGHSAFAVLERVRERVCEDRRDVASALRDTALHTVFTTHTPVEAGHDRFAPDLVEGQLGWMRRQLGLSLDDFMALGRVDIRNGREPFCMTVLAFKGSRQRNAVSDVHGHTARNMWRALWPNRSEEDIPIGHVTNGVHTLSWLAPSMKRLYDEYLGANWSGQQSEPSAWRAISQIDDGLLWEAHTALRRHLVESIRRHTPSATLDPAALTIGFARRFATYKRATLLFADRERLVRLCNDSARPVQFIFAGKAHPRDDEGKRYLQEILAATRDPRLAGRIAFIEDYDIRIARRLVQGVDVWLNTPLRPLEASGTSGQKVVVNGGLNLSVLDGWWAEAYDGLNGFTVGSTLTHSDPAAQWTRDADALYATLASEVIPLFYDRNASGLPERWIARMKRSISTLGWKYNSDRMVIDYTTGYYMPAAGGRTAAAAAHQ